MSGRRGLTHGPLGCVAAYARDDGLLALDRGVHDLVGVRGLAVVLAVDFVLELGEFASYLRELIFA